MINDKSNKESVTIEESAVVADTIPVIVAVKPQSVDTNKNKVEMEELLDSLIQDKIEKITKEKLTVIEKPKDPVEEATLTLLDIGIDASDILTIQKSLRAEFEDIDISEEAKAKLINRRVDNFKREQQERSLDKEDEKILRTQYVIQNHGTLTGNLIIKKYEQELMEVGFTQADIDAIPPKEYAKRIQMFAEKNVEIKTKVREIAAAEKLTPQQEHLRKIEELKAQGKLK